MDKRLTDMEVHAEIYRMQTRLHGMRGSSTFGDQALGMAAKMLGMIAAVLVSRDERGLSDLPSDGE